jgi:hypothetical protein
MIRLAFAAFLSGLAISAASNANAATITKSTSENCLIYLDGEIIEGDLARLQEAAKAHLTGGDGESTAKDTLCLHSPGGNLEEGTEMAEFILKNGIGTVIEEGKECYSICAVMFMMGIATGPEVNFINRKLHVKGILGFHRPYLAINSDEMVNIRAFAVVHDLAIENVMSIMILANTLSPWSNSSMIRPDLIQEMLTHIGNDFFYIDTVEKAGRFEIELSGLPEMAGVSAEQAYYACENGFHWQVGLQKEPADYAAYQDTMTKYNHGAQVSKLVKDRDGIKLFQVESADAGYSEASCLIGIKDQAILGCGINEAYNVQLGQGRCTVDDFDDRSVYLPRTVVFKPTTRLDAIGGAQERPVDTAVFKVTCSITQANGQVEREACEQRVFKGNPDEGTSDRIEFIWPTGNKTILTRGETGIHINGKPASPQEAKGKERCLVNQSNGNKFCFGE